MIIKENEKVETILTDLIPMAKVEDVSDMAAKEFFSYAEKMEELSKKVSREGLRRVFTILALYPYIGEHVDAVKNEYELELMKIALYMQGLKTQFEKAMNLEQIQEQVGREEADVLMSKVAAEAETKGEQS